MACLGWSKHLKNLVEYIGVTQLNFILLTYGSKIDNVHLHFDHFPKDNYLSLPQLRNS